MDNKKMEPNTFFPIIISHKEDVDGIVSAAILYHVNLFKGKVLDLDHNDDIEIYLVNYSEYLKLLELLIQSPLRRDLYISDLGVNSYILEMLEKMYSQRSYENKFNWSYFDHHNISEYDYNKMCKFFDLFKNSSFPSRKDLLCASDLLFLEYKKILPLHFKELRVLAHIMDFRSESKTNMRISDSLLKLAAELNKYITYYQDSPDVLYDLIKNMQTEEGWNKFKKSLKIKVNKIDSWFLEQRDEILRNISFFKQDKYKFACSAAKIRSGKITRELMGEYPDVDLYMGFSYNDMGINIRSNFHIMDKVAEFFGGGGHSDRAGFIYSEKGIPEENCKFPEELAQEIANKFIKYLRNS